MTRHLLAARRRVAGLSLIEIMVALAMGALLSLGIMTLFTATSSTSRVQDGLARLQENGRYVVQRVESDLRMLGGQFCSNRAGQAIGSGETVTFRNRAPMVYAATLPLAGSGRGINFPPTGPSTAAATSAYAISPRWFVQGYECTGASYAGETCTPALPTQTGGAANGFPAKGITAGARVANSDVLTLRYQSGTGWPLTAANCTNNGALTIEPQAGDDPINFAANDIALVTDCVNPVILPIRAVAGNLLTVGTLLGAPSASVCSAVPSEQDVRAFNFSRDFVTVSYYLAMRLDQNAGARPNTGTGTARMIPTLVRREGTGDEQELVQGVDRLDFLYGVRDGNGATRYLNAAQVNNRLGGTIPCSTRPDGVATDEAGCLWRSVRSVEIHALLNTVDDAWDMDAASRTYRYSLDGSGFVTPPATLVSGLRPGSMMRREFVSVVSVRNFNP